MVDALNNTYINSLPIFIKSNFLLILFIHSYITAMLIKIYRRMDQRIANNTPCAKS
jgi:hypothetical protein